VRQRLSRAEQVERNRELLLEAALTVFLKHGYGRATIDAIADEAGFSKGVVYSQFESKADLFLTLLERRIKERAEENQRVAGDLAGADAVRALLRNVDRTRQEYAGWAQLLLEFRVHAGRDVELNRRYAAAHAGTLERIATLLEEIHDRAGLVPASPPQSMAEMILAYGSGLTLERLANPRALDGDGPEMLIRALGLANGEESR
jgi:AcrR family transcriptional regulator